MIQKTISFLLGAMLTISVSHAQNPDTVYYSSSKVDGYFLAFGNKAYLSTLNSKKHIQAMRDICRRKAELWALGITTPFQCTKFYYIKEGGDGPAYALQIKGTVPQKNADQALLFSSAPYPAPTWTKRKASKEEINTLATISELGQKKYAVALKKARSGKAEVIETDKHGAIFIIPWQTTDDGGSEEDDFLIAYRDSQGKYRIVEERGQILGFLDIDHDGFPELQITMYCDGTCEYVKSIRDKEIIVDISQH